MFRLTAGENNVMSEYHKNVVKFMHFKLHLRFYLTFVPI